MVKYVLTKQHFINNVLLEPGTELDIGDDMPSLGMAAVEGDAASEAKIKERDEKTSGKKDAAVSKGTMSAIAAENLIPKADKAPKDEDDKHGSRSAKR